MIKNISLFLALGLLLGTASSSHAYDREAARAYAIRWSGWIVNGSWTSSSSEAIEKSAKYKVQIGEDGSLTILEVTYE